MPFSNSELLCLPLPQQPVGHPKYAGSLSAPQFRPSGNPIKSQTVRCTFHSSAFLLKENLSYVPYLDHAKLCQSQQTAPLLVFSNSWASRLRQFCPLLLEKCDKNQCRWVVVQGVEPLLGMLASHIEYQFKSWPLHFGSSFPVCSLYFHLLKGLLHRKFFILLGYYLFIFVFINVLLVSNLRILCLVLDPKQALFFFPPSNFIFCV